MRAHACAVVLTASYALMSASVVAHPGIHATASANAAGGRADRHLRNRAAFDIRRSVAPIGTGGVSVSPSPEQAAAGHTKLRPLRRRLMSDFMDSDDVGPIYLILLLMLVGSLCTCYGNTQPSIEDDEAVPSPPSTSLEAGAGVQMTQRSPGSSRGRRASSVHTVAAALKSSSRSSSRPESELGSFGESSENPLHSEPSSPASPDNETAASKLEKELAAAEAVAVQGTANEVRETVDVDFDDIYGK